MAFVDESSATAADLIFRFGGRASVGSAFDDGEGVNNAGNDLEDGGNVKEAWASRSRGIREG